MNVARPLSIVLIEDNLADVYLIERSLRMHEIDFELVRFDNGDEALRYLCPPLELSLERPDLILLDLHLPGTEGPEILKAIGAESRLEGVPVAILTGAYLESLAKLDLARSSCIIHKSMDPEEYLSDVARAVLELRPLMSDSAQAKAIPLGIRPIEPHRTSRTPTCTDRPRT